MPGSILYVEDGPDDVLFMERALQKADPEAQLHVITDGQKAMDYFGTSAALAPGRPPVDLVLLDLNLPGRSGIDVLRQIRHHSPVPSIPVVMFSASNQQKDVDASYAEGCSAYLLKPTDFEGLRRLVRHVVDYWLHANPAAQPPQGLLPSA